MWRPCRWAALPLRNNALAEGSANVSGTMSMAASAAKSFDQSKFKAVRKDARAFGGVHRELAGWTLLLEFHRSGTGALVAISLSRIASHQDVRAGGRESDLHWSWTSLGQSNHAPNQGFGR